MIAYLKGRMLKRLPTGVILDVQGVGYELNLTLPAIASLPSVGASVEFFVYTRVREEELKLYGFTKEEEHQTFAVLLQVNGVGPRVALAILSTMKSGELRSCVERDAPEVLYPVPGIGKRTAEKILVELRGRLDRLPVGKVVSEGKKGSGLFSGDGKGCVEWNTTLEPDLCSALENLGFRAREIQPVLKDLRESYQGEDFPELIRRSLAMISSGATKSQKTPARKKSSEESLGSQF